MLLEASANINAQGRLYNNILYIALARGYIKVVEMLLGIGAEVNIERGYYSNILQVAL